MKLLFQQYVVKSIKKLIFQQYIMDAEDTVQQSIKTAYKILFSNELVYSGMFS